MSKKRDHQNVWEWFLELGPLKVAILLNVIGIAIIAVFMWIVRWVTYNR